MSIKQAKESTCGMTFFSLLSKRMVRLQIGPQYLGASGFQECRRKCRIFWQDSISILTLPLVSTTSKHQTPQELGSGHPVPLLLCVCSGCLRCKNEEKRAFFLRTTLLDTHRFFNGQLWLRLSLFRGRVERASGRVSLPPLFSTLSLLP